MGAGTQHSFAVLNLPPKCNPPICQAGRANRHMDRWQKRAMGRVAKAASLDSDGQSEVGSLLPWDHRFLITTEGASDRKFVAQESLTKLETSCGLRPPNHEELQVRTFQRDLDDGARGCFTSHMAVYAEAVAAELPYAIVFEDNLVLACDDTLSGLQKDGLSQVLRWAAEHEGKWDVIHIALVHSAASLRLLPSGDSENAVRMVQRTAPDWYGPVEIEAAPGLGTTAYIISLRGMQEMTRLVESRGYVGAPIDDLLAATFSKSTYAAFPAPLRRGSSASLINPGQELFRTVMFQPPVATWVEEALVFTTLSSSQLVWVFLAAMAGWTVFVTVPCLRLLLA